MSEDQLNRASAYLWERGGRSVVVDGATVDFGADGITCIALK